MSDDAANPSAPPHCYRPAGIKFSNAEETIQEGRDEIAKHKELTINAEGLDDGNTLAVCALVEWKRRAAKSDCRLTLANIPLRLRQLIKVYQLRALFPEAESAETAGK
ncbi:MAG: STAS domain-containing protein [Gammaproteobacteria bacterium]